jgi:hypothetical protein
VEVSKPPDGSKFQGESSPLSVTEYSFPQEWLRVNVFEIVTIIREARDEQRRLPPGSWVLGAFSTFLAFGLCLVATSQYRDVLGFKSDVWAAVLLFFTIATGFATVALFLWWLASLIRRRPRTEREIVQGIIDEMQNARAAGKVFLGRQ